MDEADLADAIRGAQRGDPAAYDRLVDAFCHRLAGFLYRLTGSRQDVEDLVQEVFVRVVRMIGAYQHDGRFEAWIFRIAANLVRDRVRRSARGPRLVAGDSGGTTDGNNGEGSALDSLASRVSAADAAMQLEEDVDALNTALGKLPEAEREVVLLRHFSGLSFKEIADMTGVPLGTALARGHRGLLRLRSIMQVGDSPVACAGMTAGMKLRG